MSIPLVPSPIEIEVSMLLLPSKSSEWVGSVRGGDGGPSTRLWCFDVAVDKINRTGYLACIRTNRQERERCHNPLLNPPCRFATFDRHQCYLTTFFNLQFRNICNDLCQ